MTSSKQHMLPTHKQHYSAVQFSYQLFAGHRFF